MHFFTLIGDKEGAPSAAVHFEWLLSHYYSVYEKQIILLKSHKTIFDKQNDFPVIAFIKNRIEPSIQQFKKIFSFQAGCLLEQFDGDTFIWFFFIKIVSVIIS